jgi:hypothetical protein
MEAVQSSETSVNSYQSTQRYNTEYSHLDSHCRENLKSCKNSLACCGSERSGSVIVGYRGQVIGLLRGGGDMWT